MTQTLSTLRVAGASAGEDDREQERLGDRLAPERQRVDPEQPGAREHYRLNRAGGARVLRSAAEESQQADGG